MPHIRIKEIHQLPVGIQPILGSDEVGYGCIAGPLVIGAVRAPRDWKLKGLNDSKKLSERQRLIMRDQLNKLIQNKEISFHLAERSNDAIDRDGVAYTLKSCYVECFRALDPQHECLVITDGNLKFDNMGVDAYNLVSLVKADGQIPAVMAASILAKTYRDDLMRQYHIIYPNYGWDHNVGYPRPDHIEAIRHHGFCQLHRRSYKIKSLNK